jgi:hypothetical protein
LHQKATAAMVPTVAMVFVLALSEFAEFAASDELKEFLLAIN